MVGGQRSRGNREGRGRMTFLAVLLGGVCVLLAVLAAVAVMYTSKNIRSLYNGPAQLAGSLGLVAVGRTRADAPFWYVGTLGDRPIAVGVTTIRTDQWQHRRNRRMVLRIVVGCQVRGQLYVRPGTLGSRVSLAEGIAPEPVLQLVGSHGLGVISVEKATPFECPNPTFAGDSPALCWLDHPDAELTDPREAKKLLDLLDRVATTLERQ